MEDSYEQDRTTEESALIDVPPAYDEEPPAIQPPVVQPPLAQPVPQIGQYPQGQVTGVLPQTWPQGYPVSSELHAISACDPRHAAVSYH